MAEARRIALPPSEEGDLRRAQAPKIIPSLDNIALTLVEKLLAAFGPFSLVWLEKDGVEISAPTRAEGLDACALYGLNARGQGTGEKFGPFSKEQADRLALALSFMPTNALHHYIARPCGQELLLIHD